MRATLQMVLGAAVLSGCAAPYAVPLADGAQAVRVTGETGPLGFDEGARAKRLANAAYGPRGVQSSINDRFEGGSWIVPEGCA